MKKWINYSIKIFLCLLISFQSFSQSETFDIATYNPPKGWKRSTGQGYVLFQNAKSVNGSGNIGILIVYASRQSAGDADKDFKMEWNDLVVKAYHLSPNPAIQKEPARDGWTLVTGTTIAKEGIYEYTCMLVSASGYGKVMSVLIKLAGKEYMTEIDNFLTTLQLDATASVNNINNVSKDLSLSKTKETFGIITYHAPNNWKKEIKDDYVSYTMTDPPAGGFCVLGIYSARKTEGTIENDFAFGWKMLAIAPFAAQENPKTEQQTTAAGWKVVSAVAPITSNGSPAYVALTTFSDFKKTASVLAVFNDQSYTHFIDQFLENITFDKNAELPKRDGVAANISSGNSILGVWSSSNISIGNYVTSSGTFVGSADASTMEEYGFNADNSYLYKFFGNAGGKLYYTETSGNFKLDGRHLILTPVKRKGGYSGAIKDEMEMLGKPETYDCYIGPNKWEAGPFLNLHKDGNYYMWSDYPYDYFKKIK